MKFFSVSSDAWIEEGGGVLEVDEMIDVIGIALFDFKTTKTNVGDRGWGWMLVTKLSNHEFWMLVTDLSISSPSSYFINF